MSFLVPSRYCGPPQSGNGGWVSGHAAVLLSGALAGVRTDGDASLPAGAVTVRLRTPPPLDRDMSVVTATDESATDSVRLTVHDGAHLVLEATPAARLTAYGIPGPVEVAAAEAAAAHFEGLERHPFPTCFSCGIDRPAGDGLGLRPGRVAGGAGEYACAWVPADDVDVEIVWATLDCPGGWCSGVAERPMVLGTMTAQVDALPRAGEPHVVMAWHRGAEGRKHHSGTALYADDGTLLAQAEATWIAIDPQSIRPAGGTA